MLRRIRFSIAGLMGVVLVAAVGFAALRTASEAWAGWMFLLTCGVLTLAVVGSSCRGPEGRAGWLGFALFGWGYLALALWHSSSQGTLPTISLAEAIGSRLGGHFVPPPTTSPDWYSLSSGCRILHCLWALGLAYLGCLMAGFLVSIPSSREPRPEDFPLRDRKRWRRPAIVGLSGFGLTAAAAAAGRWSTPAIWAGAIFMLTGGLLGLALLGAVFSRGRDRETWLGAALFGFVYLFLTFGWPSEHAVLPRRPAEPLIDAIFRHGEPPLFSELPDSADQISAAHRRLLRNLEQPIRMHFPDWTSLDEVLKYIRQATQDSASPGIPIYIDPVGLQQAGQTLKSTVSIDFEVITVKDALRLILKQLGMRFGVGANFVIITTADDPRVPSVPIHDDPILIVGNCLLALIAAGLGALAAPLVSDLRRRPAAP